MLFSGCKHVSKDRTRSQLDIPNIAPPPSVSLSPGSRPLYLHWSPPRMANLHKRRDLETKAVLPEPCDIWSATEKRRSWANSRRRGNCSPANHLARQVLEGEVCAVCMYIHTTCYEKDEGVFDFEWTWLKSQLYELVWALDWLALVVDRHVHIIVSVMRLVRPAWWLMILRHISFLL